MKVQWTSANKSVSTEGRAIFYVDFKRSCQMFETVLPRCSGCAQSYPGVDAIRQAGLA